jgi:hypothetical protein
MLAACTLAGAMPAIPANSMEIPKIVVLFIILNCF